MADIIWSLSKDKPIPLRWVDQLDGTYALKVSFGGASIDIGDVTLLPGSAIVGKVGIDQTTPGTTDSVSVSTAQGAGAAIGAISGAAVITDANGTIQQYLRGLVKLWITGGLGVAQAASASGGYSFLNIPAGQATTVVKAGAGTLHSIILNSPATATNTTTVYDHPSGAGTVIGRPNVVAATVPSTLLYDLAFANGLTIITGTADGGDMTVVFK